MSGGFFRVRIIPVARELLVLVCSLARVVESGNLRLCLAGAGHVRGTGYPIFKQDGQAAQNPEICSGAGSIGEPH